MAKAKRVRDKRLPKVLVLDHNIWVNGNTVTDNNYSCMLNGLGNECCLGQFSEQAGVPKDKLQDRGTPGSVVNVHGPDYRVSCLARCSRHSSDNDTKLSKHAMLINDHRDTSVASKVVELRKLFATVNRKIKLVNFPDNVLLDIIKTENKDVLTNLVNEGIK